MPEAFAQYEAVGKILLGLLVLYFAGVVVRIVRGGRRDQSRPVRARLEQQARVENPDPRFALDVATATVVHETTTSSGFGRESYTTHHRILRNPHGQYFLQVYSPADESSYDSLLTREQAMNALRDDPEAFRREFGDAAT